jgi:hypothetical protein
MALFPQRMVNSIAQGRLSQGGFTPIKDARNPLSCLGTVPNLWQPVLGMEIPAEKAFYRIQQIAKLGHWTSR